MTTGAQARILRSCWASPASSNVAGVGCQLFQEFEMLYSICTLPGRGERVSLKKGGLVNTYAEKTPFDTNRRSLSGTIISTSRKSYCL